MTRFDRLCTRLRWGKQVRRGVTVTNVLMLWIGGNDVAITFNERNPQAVRLAEAMKNLDAADLNVVTRLAGKGFPGFRPWGSTSG